ncbi:hypothetical protein K438DRAFT_741560 [Mycena galopus ATCC 62051]|nr:hypothetical protein K438DRAFT_741560 [Mycena galopus ATCC 62051]
MIYFPGYPPYVLKDAHSLHEIQLYGAPWMLTIPNNSMKIYGSEEINILECIDVLRNATELSSATFDLVGHAPQDPITSLSPLFNLLDLTLSEGAHDTIGVAPLLMMNLLRLLTLPSLKHLTLKCTRTDNPLSATADISELLFLASRSLHQLEKLSLCLLPSSETEFLQCLQRTQSITTLRLQLHIPLNDVLHRLTYDTDFLPRLETLYVVHTAIGWRDVDPLCPTPDEMLDMLVSRRFCADMVKGPVRLRTFHFARRDSDAADLFTASVISDARYKLFEGSGMNISVGEMMWEDEGELWYVDD